MDAIINVPAPVNEPVRTYAPGSPERAELEVELARMASTPIDLPHVIGGQEVVGHDGQWSLMRRSVRSRSRPW